eukprot:GILK01006919.1.p1 GENE.GILK01006919.1~~GILK01006919.1.p1  ORF type:complete len:327 (-),score=45.05 GILK01006919.1:24-1004(-)
MVFWSVVVAFFILPVLALLQGAYNILKGKLSPLKLSGAHVFITGGSQGLGKAFAKLVVSRGANVTIVARNATLLESARAEILGKRSGAAKVFAISADVTDSKAVLTAVERAEKENGPVDLLVTCAGAAKPGYITEQDYGVFESQMQLNYFGVVKAIKAVLPSMIARKRGRICIVTSACAMAAFSGYTQYCATKFALRGFSDCLRNEMRAHGVDVSIFFPSNMDTPGFAEENKQKPEDTRLIEGGGKLFTADQSAADLLLGLDRGYYQITQELPVELLRIGASGVCPRDNVFFDLMLAPFLPLLSVILSKFWDYTVTTTAAAKSKTK